MTFPGESPTLDQCTIQSVYGYFKQDLNNFNYEQEEDGYTKNYLNTLDVCLS